MALDTCAGSQCDFPLKVRKRNISDEDSVEGRTEAYWSGQDGILLECKSKVTHSIESEPTCSDLCGAVSLDSEGQPPGPDEESRPSAAELHTQLNKVLIEHVGEIPGVFKRYGLNQNGTKLQVRVSIGSTMKAKEFLQEYIGEHPSVEITEESFEIDFLGVIYPLAKTETLPAQCIDQIERGSMVSTLSPCDEETLDCTSEASRVNNKFGTITGILKDKKSKEYYGLASGHVLLGTIANDHGWSAVPYNKTIISQYVSLESTGNIVLTELADQFFAGMEYWGNKDSKQSIDIGIFKIPHFLVDTDLIKLDLGNYNHGPPVVYEENLSNLVGKEVVKVGAETGVTNGKVTAMNQTVIVKVSEKKELVLTGMLLIASTNGVDFGRSGDSGSPIFYPNQGRNDMVGYICAGSYDIIPQPDGTSVKKYKEVYGISMESTIKYIQMKTGLELQFPIDKNPPDTDIQEDIAASDERVHTYERSAPDVTTPSLLPALKKNGRERTDFTQTSVGDFRKALKKRDRTTRCLTEIVIDDVKQARKNQDRNITCLPETDHKDFRMALKRHSRTQRYLTDTAIDDVKLALKKYIRSGTDLTEMSLDDCKKSLTDSKWEMASVY